jgi:hypothetical protein
VTYDRNLVRDSYLPGLVLLLLAMGIATFGYFGPACIPASLGAIWDAGRQRLSDASVLTIECLRLLMRGLLVVMLGMGTLALLQANVLETKDILPCWIIGINQAIFVVILLGRWLTRSAMIAGGVGEWDGD